MMKILFVGLGSIGLRNLRACRAVRPQYQYAAWRSQSSTATKSSEDLTGVAQFQQLEEVLEFRPDLVWVCNPTHLHAQVVRQLAGAGPAFFIEKPLAHLSEDLVEIEKALEQSGGRFFYGCVMRQHPVIRKVKKIIEDGDLGRPLTYSLNCGSYLPSWRPGSDYREIYSAHRDQGGGVELDLIHEFDFAEWWFGELIGLDGYSGRVSPLEIDSHDLCQAVTHHGSSVRGQITLNYFRAFPRRDFEICFTEGVIEGDLLSSRLSWKKLGDSSQGKQVQEFPLERDDLYRSQAEEVLHSLETGGQALWNVADAARLNRTVIEWANRGPQTGKPIK